MSEIKWVKIQNISLARAVRNVGFDLSAFHKYKPATKKEAKTQSVKQVVKVLAKLYEEQTERDLGSVKKGVYVICLSPPFTIEYKNGQSEIIYIGQGNVLGRLEAHFHTTLFSFMQSLSGTNFDFYIAEPKRRGGGKSTMYHKQIEYSLLNQFEEKFGGHNGQFPILNKNSGSDKNIIPGRGWDKPLSGAGKKPSWALTPTKHRRFTKLKDQ